MQTARELLAVKIAGIALLAALTTGCTTLTLPFVGSVSSPNGPAFSVTNTSTGGVLGVPNGVVGASSGAGYGVLGTSQNGEGVLGQGGDADLLVGDLYGQSHIGLGQALEDQFRSRDRRRGNKSELVARLALLSRDRQSDLVGSAGMSRDEVGRNHRRLHLSGGCSASDWGFNLCVANC